MIEKLSSSDKYQLLSGLLQCGADIYLWKYGPDGHIIETNSPYLVLDTIFERSGNKAYMLEQLGELTAPLIMGKELGLLWCAIFTESDSGSKMVYVLGPVFNSEISAQTLEQSASRYNIDLSWREGYIQLMNSLPVVSSVLFFQQALTAHYLINGEKLNRSDLHFQQWQMQDDKGTQMPKRDRMQVWLAERALLNMIREGDLNYKSALNHANAISSGIRAGSKNPLLNAIVSCTGFTTLCAREAIHAGISPEIAYSVGDSYIQSMLDAKNISELTSINHAMYEDYIMRVHRHRTNPKVSHQIQACRDYIELHADQDITLASLAQRVGYSEYHLSRKFKQEMGISIRTYIRYARIERSKILLETTTYSNAKIAELLQFCSGSHFSTAFQEVTGQTPMQYRQSHQKI